MPWPGSSRPEVRLECRFDDVSLASDEAIVRVTLRRNAGDLVLEVADDGVGMKRSGRTRGTGIGSRLVETFVKQVKARHQVSTGDGGTRHRIYFPGSPS